MKKLYHGSGFIADELMPGFKHTGKLVKWDGTESNEWLYAAATREEAISQGFASTLEKHYNVGRFKSEGNKIYIEIENGKVPTEKEMKALDVYLYTIAFSDAWQLVNNLTNGIKDEYKTKETIKDDILEREKLDIAKWFSGKDVKVVSRTNRSYDW